MPPPIGNGAISVVFVHLSVAYIAIRENKGLACPNLEGKVPHLRCDSHTSFKVKRSKVRVRGGQEHTVLAEPGGHTCLISYFSRVWLTFYASTSLGWVQAQCFSVRHPLIHLLPNL